MNLEFREINYWDVEDCRRVARWNNDGRIRHLFMPFRDAVSAETFDSVKSVRDRHLRDSPFRAVLDQLIVLDGEPVGMVSLTVDPPHKLTRDERTAWFGIVIGEHSARGRGVGTRAMAHLERFAADSGLGCAEIGVFEFNEAAIGFYRSLGYVEIGRVEEFTWWNGRRWADVRMAKELPRLERETVQSFSGLNSGGET